MTRELLAQLGRVADFVNEATCAVNDHGRAELYKQGLDALGDIDKMRAHLRNHPAAVPEDPPIEEVEAIITCLGDDAAQLRDKNPDCEIAANMDQAVALIRILLAIPAAAFDQALPRYLADEREVDPA